MDRIRVAQGVRRDAPSQTRPPGSLAHDAIRRLPGERPAPVVQPQRGDGLGGQLGSCVAHIGFHPGPGFGGDGQHAGLAALAGDAQGLVPGEYGVGTEAHRLGNSQPRSVKQFQERSITQVAGGIEVRVLQELGEFGGGQGFGQVAQGATKAEVRPIPLRPPPGADHPPIEATQGRKAAQTRAGGDVGELRVIRHHVGGVDLGELGVPLSPEPKRRQVQIVLVRD